MAYEPTIAGPNHGSAAEAGAGRGLYPSNVGGLGANIGTSGAIGNIYDYNPFSILRAVHERHETCSDFRFILDALGMSRGVNAPTTGHYERDFKHNAIRLGATITSGASAGAGQPAIIALHADSMFDNNQDANGSGVLSSDIEENDVIEFYNGQKGLVVLKNTATNPHRISIRPYLAADEIPAVTNGGYYSINQSAFGEGTGLPKGKIPRVTKYTNVFQTVKVTGGATGTSLTDQLFVQFVPGQDSNMFVQIKDLAMYEFERKNNGALLFGGVSDNLTATPVGANDIDTTIKTTEGMIEWAQAYGHEQEYTLNTYSLADFDAISTTMTEERIGTRILMTLDGHYMFRDTENLLYGEFVGDVTPMVMKSLAAQAPAQDDWQPFENPNFSFYIGFKGVHKGGFDYCFKNLHEFSDTQGVGTEAYGKRSWRIALPLGGSSKNYATGKSGFKWGYEWRQDGSYSRKVVTGIIAGAGVAGVGGYVNTPFAANQYDQIQQYMISEVAFHGACPNQVYIQKPTT